MKHARLSLASLLAFAACIQAARFPSYDSIHLDGLPTSLVDWQTGSSSKEPLQDNALLGSTLYNDLEALATDPAINKDKGWPIHISTKFLVKPDHHINFVRNFQRYSEASRDSKGILHLSLSKLSGDNIVWTSYTVYRDIHALFRHMRSDALRDFASFITNTNIAVEYKLLIKVGGCHHKGAAENGCFEPNMGDVSAADASSDNKKGWDKHKGWPLQLATAYIVPPGEGRAFVKEFEKAEKSIAKVKGNIAFVLMKPAGDNVLFVGYSAWKSYEDFWEAARSKGSEEWLEFLGDKGIVEVTRQVWTVPDHRH
jgi:quinol monooxygenase YgiN